VRKYKLGHAAVDVRPYDYEGRNAYHEKYGLLTKPGEVGDRLEQLAMAGKLTGTESDVWNAYKRTNDTLNTETARIPYFINQEAYYDITARRQHLQYYGLREIIERNDSLERYREFYRVNADFWEIRNKAMADHILNFIKRYPGKRIFVLTGSMHKYYLLNELAPRQQELHFLLREYYDHQ
jgi:erythromycin esterase-like protein